VNYLFLAPWIIFSLSPAVLFQQSILVAGLIVTVGEVGMLTNNRRASMIASSSLLFVILWSKVASDLYSLPSPDTAVLLLQFLVTIFLMEASASAIVFRITSSQISKVGEVSQTSRTSLNRWAVGQLTGLAKLFVGGFLLSLALLVVGSIISVSFSQLALTGALALGAVVAILFLLTYRREPQTMRTR